jgi:hypothetical protein
MEFCFWKFGPAFRGIEIWKIPFRASSFASKPVKIIFHLLFSQKLRSGIRDSLVENDRRRRRDQRQWPFGSAKYPPGRATTQFAESSFLSFILPQSHDVVESIKGFAWPVNRTGSWAGMGLKG